MKFLLQTTIFVCLILSANLANAGETVIQRIGPELNHPWGLAIFNGNKVLVTTRPGQLYQIDTSLGSSRLITNTPNVVEHRQGGLLDVAVKKEDETIIVFLCYTKDVGSSKTSTAIYRGILDGDQLSKGSDIFVSNHSSSSGLHFGCRLALKDTYLYASIGDRGNRNSAQDPTSHSGAIIRLRLNTEGESHSRPKDWLKEIYSIGHRNPQGLIFNKRTGDLWSHEHGPRGGDEINIISFGKNYGWPTVSYGKEYFGGNIGLNYSPSGYIDPVWKWTPSIAPSGMVFYSGKMFPEINGKLLVGSLKFMRLFVVSLGQNGLPSTEESIFKNTFGRIRDVDVLQDGSILILNDETEGGLFRVSRRS